MHLINWSSVSVRTSIKIDGLPVCWSGAFRCVLTHCGLQGGWFRLVWQPQHLGTSGFLPARGLFSIPRVKCGAICSATKLGWNWVIHQDNDLKHTRKSTAEWLKSKIQGAAMVQLKFRSQSKWNAVLGAHRGCGLRVGRKPVSNIQATLASSCCC